MSNRWAILAALFLVRTCLGFQMQSVASVSPFLVEEWGVPYAAIGTLIGAFMLPGFVIALPSGMLGRRFADRPLVIAGLGLMIAGGLLTGFAESYGWALAGRLLSGTGAVLNIVFLAKMVTDWFAGREIVTAMSVLVTSWPLGIALGQLTQGAVATAAGWPAVMHLSALLAGLGLVLVATLYRPAPTAPAAAGPAKGAGLSAREFRLVSLAGLVWACLNVGYIVYLSFAPALLTAGGMGLVRAGAVASLASWACLLSIPFGGYLAERIGRPHEALVLGHLIGAASLLLLPLGVAPELLCLAVGLFGVAPAGIVMSLPGGVLKPENRALGMGVFYTWYYGLMALGPGLAGLAFDLTGSAAAPILVGAGFFAAGAAIFGAFRAVQRRYSSLS